MTPLGRVRLGITAVLATCIIVIGLLVVHVDGQVQDQSPGCQDAARWHLHQAMRFGQAEDQPFHLGAAQAAQQLATLGDDCKGWQDEANRPSGPTASMTAADTDALQTNTKATT